MSSRLLFPLACPLPPLLRLLPTHAAARFYSPFRLSTSLVTPTSRRPINRHGLLSISRTYSEQASHTKPTIEEIKKWNEDELLTQIHKMRPELLRDNNLEKFKAAFIDGNVFMDHAGDVEFFENKCKLPIGISERLAKLAREVTGGETARKKEDYKDGIEYARPDRLVHTNGKDWAFQPHPKLYETLATNVLEHYTHYKKGAIDKTYLPTYFYLGGAGTGKSRHGSEFASSVKNAITLCSQDPLYEELSQRLEDAFVFHVSFENGTPLTREEKKNPWNAIGIRMLHQLTSRPIEDLDEQYVADPRTVFRLVAKAQGVDLYDDFTGILVVDGIQRVLTGNDDGQDKKSDFYGFLSQIGGLSLMLQRPSEGEEVRKAPFIVTCVTATCLGPAQGFLAETHQKRVYLPLNRLKAPTWKKSNLPVLKPTRLTKILVDDIDGHARAMELIVDLLDRYGPEPNISQFAERLCIALEDHYEEALSLLKDHTLPIVQCILSRREILLGDKIPGSEVRWEQVTSSGLIWFEKTTNYGTKGYLVAPYIWLWVLARLPTSKGTELARVPASDTDRFCQFLSDWQFNDYVELLHLTTGRGNVGNTTWQSFEKFCCSFRILRSLGIGDRQQMSLKNLHSGCKLRDDKETIVLNRHLQFAKARRQYPTKSTAIEEVETQHNGTLDADAQLSNIILNAPGASAGDIFFSIKTRSPKGKGSQGKIVREVGQCKLIKAPVTQDLYDAEREKSADPDDIFMLYTRAKISGDFALPDRSGLVDKSCWDSYFGLFAGRAYRAWNFSGPKDNGKPRQARLA